MAVYQLLMRGMLVGMVAGMLAFGLAKVVGEPAVDRAIAFEGAAARAKGEAEEPELVSRFVQSTVGLPIGEIIYGGALGGLFSLIFAVAYGRFSRLSPKACSAVLALLCFIAAFAVPYLKYPANPPAVGEPATIGLRTGLFFSMIGISIVAMMAAFSLKRWIEPRIGAWNASLAGGLLFLVLVGLAGVAMPAINEVPGTFPASTLWQFRLASFGIQAILWGVIGLLFGTLTERSLKR